MYEWFYKVKRYWWMLKTRCFYPFIFGQIGRRCTVCKPMYIAHPENMYLGNKVRVREYARIETITNYNGQKFTPRLEIGNNVGFEQGLHLICANSVRIGNDVTVSAYVMIMDTSHDYNDLEKSVLEQHLSTSPVKIEDGCFIGYGARIMPGVHMGKHCIVGANAVVLGRDKYEDYSVLAGVPARCIKRYDIEANVWKKTDKNGVFIE